MALDNRTEAAETPQRNLFNYLRWSDPVSSPLKNAFRSSFDSAQDERNACGTRLSKPAHAELVEASPFFNGLLETDHCSGGVDLGGAQTTADIRSW